MKLWLISQSKNNDYDTYDSAVVAAETEEQARRTHPDNKGSCDKVWDDSLGAWRHKDSPEAGWGVGRTWTEPHHVAIKYIGEAAEGTEPGVICASFNAG